MSRNKKVATAIKELWEKINIINGNIVRIIDIIRKQNERIEKLEKLTNSLNNEPQGDR